MSGKSRSAGRFCVHVKSKKKKKKKRGQRRRGASKRFYQKKVWKRDLQKPFEKVVQKKKKKKKLYQLPQEGRNCPCNGVKAISALKSHSLGWETGKKKSWRTTARLRGAFVQFRAENIHVFLFEIGNFKKWISGCRIHYGAGGWNGRFKKKTCTFVAACVKLLSYKCLSVFEGVGGGGLQGFFFCFLLCFAVSGVI